MTTLLKPTLPLLLAIPLSSVLVGTAEPVVGTCHPTSATAIIWNKTFDNVPAAICDSGNLYLKLENYTGSPEAFGGVYYNGGYNCLFTRVRGGTYEYQTCHH